MASFSHPDWCVRPGPEGTEIVFQPKVGGAAFVVPLIAGGVIGLLCLYGIWVIAGGWLHGEEVLPGGVVFVLLLAGGLFFARRCIRLAFRRERYVLGASTLRLYNNSSGLRPHTIIEKEAITEVVRACTPPSEPGQRETWRTAVVYRGAGGGRKEFFFEGYDEEISQLISSEIKTWLASAAPVHIVNTASDEGANQE